MLTSFSDHGGGLLVDASTVAVQLGDVRIGDDQVVGRVFPDILVVEWLYGMSAWRVQATQHIGTYSPQAGLGHSADLAAVATATDLGDFTIAVSHYGAGHNSHHRVLACASNMSISGAERPTYSPVSPCTGPGCDSPGQVQRESLWPGRKESTPLLPLSLSPSDVAAIGRPLNVWFGAVPTSHASYVYGHCVSSRPAHQEGRSSVHDKVPYHPIKRCTIARPT